MVDVRPRTYPSNHSDSVPHRRQRRQEQWGRRSLHFLRADNQRHLENPLKSDADALVLDLETVPTAELESARETVREVVGSGDFKGKKRIVRIHGVSGDKWYDDLVRVIAGHPDTILPAWAQSDTEMSILDAFLTQMERHEAVETESITLLPLIEVIAGLMNVASIAQSTPRVSGLMFGAGDYGMDMDHHEPDQEEGNILLGHRGRA